MFVSRMIARLASSLVKRPGRTARAFDIYGLFLATYFGGASCTPQPQAPVEQPGAEDGLPSLG